MVDYYKLYKEKKKQTSNYEKYINSLEGLRNKLSKTDGWSGFADEIKEINKKIDALMEDLPMAVRHNYRFSEATETLLDEKENLPLYDSLLSSADDELEGEIKKLSKKKSVTEAERDDYYKKWEESTPLWPFS